MSERDDQWQVQQDAIALGDATGSGLGLGEPGDPVWDEELDFYASLAEHAMRDAPPSSNDDALIEAAIAAVPPVPAANSVPRLGLVAAGVVLAAVALLWSTWPEEAQLRGVERSWSTEAQDVLDGMSKRLEQAETPVVKPKPKLAPKLAPEAEPALPTEAEPDVQFDAEAAEAQPAQARRGSSEPRADAATLVAMARAARGEGRLADAERSYGELLRAFPQSAEAGVGRVALAQIKLGRGKAQAALRLFTVAAKGGGPLAEEAAWGKIQALHRLGRKDALRQAVDAFVRDYPTSVYRARAQGQLNP